MNLGDTIAAISSPPGRSVRGLVRVSGPATRAVVRAWVDEEKGSDPFFAFFEPRVLRRVRLVEPRVPGLLVVFAGPASFTGEDAAELQVVGHPAVLDRVLRRAYEAGARGAEPGEFSYRAVVHGKLDLTAAEGVAATIAAVGDAQLRAAGELRRGRLGAFAEAAADRVATLLALVEAGIDFTDQEDVVPIPPGELLASIEAERAAVRDLLGRSRSWGTVEAVPRVVLMGRPSAGKSTLFNALLGRERAVVDAVPGTTRDVLEEPLRVEVTGGEGGEAEVMLVDMAGLDAGAAEADDPWRALDMNGQAAARAAVQRADLVLHVVDAAVAHADIDAPDLPLGVPVLRVWTKRDLAPPAAATPGDVVTSATTDRGLHELHRAIAAHLGTRAASIGGEALALRPRHEVALRAAADALDDAHATLEPWADARSLPAPELIALPLRRTLDELAGLAGRLTPDDILGRVFATFCVGK